MFSNKYLRTIVQLIFAFVVIAIGVQFILFVYSTAGSGELNNTISRPAGVEGFLPISALIGLKAWFSGKGFDPVHPAGLVIFLTAVTVSLVFKRAFCSWICPIGTISEILALLGRKVFRMNFQIPKWGDYCLRALKYLLLFLFGFVVFIVMTGADAAAFLQSPYNMIADVKMLLFFQNLSMVGIAVILLLILFSMLYENFWCRYLCPYGALLGLVSFLSPLKIRRNHELCIDCNQCSKACPNRISVHQQTIVRSPECTSCLACINDCPAKGALEIKPLPKRRGITMKHFALGIITLWAVFVITAKLTGHWETNIPLQMYKALIPVANQVGQ